jgi:hypothetical protein
MVAVVALRNTMVWACWTVTTVVLLGWSVVWSLGPSGHRIGEMCVTHLCWIKA